MKELEFAITQSAFTSIRDGLNDELELARIALAALEAAPEPVVPESISVRQAISALESADCVTTIGQAYKMGWNACRAAMLQGSQPVSNRDELQVIGWLRSDYNSDDKRDPDAPLFMLGSNNPSETWGVKYMPLTGNSPVTPDGWISCSERMPNDKDYVWCWGKSYGWTECDTFEGYYDWSRNKWWAVTDDVEEPASKVTHWMLLPEPPQQEVK
ncbi:DUF551 domain-containing protein [Salmonella enterica subsp. enterica serovar Infantis]|uniref:DUF551 domain-containing protein n=3 Tax=Salmonella enterica I TaxID=59201 RepID=A0A5W2A1K9_SALMO|nr:DUF551 domain-containing protein [Salmonella enterica]EAA3878057.1 DUF551 domain-containing protein [Salmonella enterica subsp. enterica serovar Infantis]EAA4238015.1 DUF551 domain-containing protein [Salmonella enterica subsp. enterica serovar Braenderup]EAB7298694.1 DUF551 domain-containing protein [Salmonella enterica subsp. enterica]EBS1502593.1 DUF551 domain-containing protein [Salmonella enterica subsp. enterica serovar Thompson]EBS4372281.1 DUF551 domain-containing protein [Salmonell